MFSYLKSLDNQKLNFIQVLGICATFTGFPGVANFVGHKLELFGRDASIVVSIPISLGNS